MSTWAIASIRILFGALATVGVLSGIALLGGGQTVFGLLALILGALLAVFALSAIANPTKTNGPHSKS